MSRLLLVVVLMSALVLSACGATATAGTKIGSLEVSGVWARPSTGGSGGMHGDSGATMNGAAYLQVRNTGSTADRLIKATSDIAEMVELHTVVREGDVMKMEPVEAIDVPANGEAILKPGGFHIMLLGLKQELKVGEKFTITLQFEQAGTVEVQAEVRSE